MGPIKYLEDIKLARRLMILVAATTLPRRRTAAALARNILIDTRTALITASRLQRIGGSRGQPSHRERRRSHHWARARPGEPQRYTKGTTNAEEAKSEIEPNQWADPPGWDIDTLPTQSCKTPMESADALAAQTWASPALGFARVSSQPSLITQGLFHPRGVATSKIR